MIVYLENPRESMINLTQKMKEFSKKKKKKTQNIKLTCKISSNLSQ